MDLRDPGKWRKSKVESFIRRQLNIFDLGMTRYYEMCMWDNKGNLLPSYAILMHNSIVVTENPPKSIVQTIPLSRIQNISLVADRHSLIKGKNNNSYICQHISIVYESCTGKRATKKPDTASSSSKGDVLNGDISRPASSLNLNDAEDRGSTSSHTDLSVTTNSQYSGISPSPIPSTLEDTFISSSLLSVYEPTIRLVSAHNFAWLRTSSDAMSMDKSELEKLLFTTSERRNYSLYLYNSDGKNQRKKRLMEVNTNEEDDGNASSSPVISRKWGKEYNRKNKPRTVARHPMADESHNNIVNGRKGSSERRSRSKPPAEPHEIDEPETLEQRVNKINKENNDQQQKNGRGAPKTLDKVLDLHLYFYQRDSEFLNELSLVWNRQQVKNTERQEEDTLGERSSKSLILNRNLRAAEKIISRVAQDWHLNDDIHSSPSSQRGLSKHVGHEALLRKVIHLHKCLMRYEHLKYLCWKNSVIMVGLINALIACLEPTHNSSHDGDIQEEYSNKVAIYAILMDIFRTLYEACSVSWFKETEYITGKQDLFYNENFNEWEEDVWDYKLTIFDITRKLLESILTCPFLPRSRDIPDGQRCFVTITDPQKFVKTPWLTLNSENSTKMAKLICTAHNASVALLFELLAITQFLPTFIEKTIVTYGIRQTNLDGYIRMSVTQIINILWSNRDPMSASETMILYRQVWNLRKLLKHDPKILQFIRENFSEEFHYYAHTKGIKSRIPDQYTIKHKVIDVCEKLCEDVVGKPGVKK